MAVSFVAGTSNTAVASTSFTLSAPVGIQVDDLMVATFSCNLTGTTVTVPTGWVPTPQIGQTSPYSGVNYGNPSITCTWIFTKVATSSDTAGTTYTFTYGLGRDSQGGIGLYRGVDTTNSIRGSAFTTEANALLLTMTAAQVTGCVAGDMAVWMWGTQATGTTITEATSTEVYEAASTGTSIRPNAQSYLVQAADGSSPAETATLSNASNPHGIHTLILQQAAGGGPTTETLEPDSVVGTPTNLTASTGTALAAVQATGGAYLAGTDPSGSSGSVGPSRPTSHAAVAGFTAELTTQANAYDTSTISSASSTMATLSANYGNYFLFSSTVFSGVPAGATITDIALEITDQAGTNNRSDQFYQLGTANGTLVGSEFQQDATTTKQTRTITYANLGSPSVTQADLVSGTFGVRVRSVRTGTIAAPGYSLFDVRVTVSYTVAGSTTATDVRVTLQNPVDSLVTGASTGVISAWLRKLGSGTDPTANIRIRRSGSNTDVGAQTGITISGASFTAQTYTFDQSILSGDGNDVEIFVDSAGASGGLVEVDHINWVAQTTPAGPPAAPPDVYLSPVAFDLY